MTDAHVIQIASTGGPEVLELREISVPEPGPGEVLAREVRSRTGGSGAEVVLDGVGAASWTASLGSVGAAG
jgi:NADPH:quinone reductase-like Zn-dependent oxidoreductase